MPGPLCPALYGRLRGVFDEVKIAHAGEEAQITIREPILASIHAGERGRVEVESAGEYYRVNCFAPETLVVTPEGDKPIQDLVGIATLLVPNAKNLGLWREVEVRSFGRQRLLTVRLRRMRSTKTIRVTAGHRWVLADGKSVVTTDRLNPGDELAACFTRNLRSYGTRIPNPASLGVAQGFVYGDGSKAFGDRKPASVVLFAQKDDSLLPYFTSCRRTTIIVGGKEFTRVQDLPRSWKDLPSFEESLSFLLGWFSGYFAADGHVVKSGKQAVIYSADLSSLNFVKGICYQLGVRVSPIRTRMRTGFGVERELHSLSFAVRDLPESFWIQAHHKASAQKHQERTESKQFRRWVVEEIENQSEESEVYCAVVPGVERFTLADNLLTMNCPFCGDTKFRLWFAHRWAEYQHLAICYKRNCLKDPANRKSLRNRVLTYNTGPVRFDVLPGNRTEKTVKAAPYLGDVTLLRNLQPYHEARQYMIYRGFDPDYLSDHYGVSYVERVLSPNPSFRSMAGRIYIPVYMRGLLVGWQGRYIGDPPRKEIPKYFTCPGFAKSLILYNFDLAANYRTIVLCEGVTSAWKVGPEAVALLGKTVSQTQIQLLYSTWALRQGTLVWSLDGDVGDVSSPECDDGPLRELFIQLSRAFNGQSFCRPLAKDTDPGGFTMRQNRDSIAAWARYYSVGLPDFAL